MSPQSQPVSCTVRFDNPRVQPPLALIDADNTLWDTDGLFADAQLRLLSAVEEVAQISSPPEDRLTFVRTFDQELAQQHHQGLRYPPRLLIDALIFGLHGIPHAEAVRRAWREGSRSGLDRSILSGIENEFLQDISRQPPLLKGVAVGLRDLSTAGVRAVVLTEGSRKRVMRSIEFHQLSHLIDRVFEAPKTVRMFERVKSLADANQPVYVIGDQLTRDIQPANEAGVKTIYVPGRFQPKWERETSIQPTFRAPSFDVAASLLIHSEDGKPTSRDVGAEGDSLRVQNRT